MRKDMTKAMKKGTTKVMQKGAQKEKAHQHRMQHLHRNPQSRKSLELANLSPTRKQFGKKH
eukprot:508575-Karenia_brevis.AAC.1